MRINLNIDGCGVVAPPALRTLSSSPDLTDGRDDSTQSAHRLRLLGVNQRGQHQPKKDTGVTSTATNNIIRRDYDEDVVRHNDNDINLRGFQSHQDTSMSTS